MKRYLRISLLFLFLGIACIRPGFAQLPERADSLLSLLSRSEEKEKADILVNIADVLYMQDPGASLKYSEQARELALKHNDAENLARSLALIGFAYFYLYDYRTAIDYLEQSLQNYNRTRDKAKQAGLIKNIGLCYLKLAEFGKAKEYLQEAADRFLEQGESDRLAETFINLGLVCYLISDYSGALDYYKKTTDIYAQTGNPEMQSQLYNRIGMTYYSLGIYDKALGYVLKSITLKKENDLRGKSISHNNLGAIYKDLEEPEMALENYRMALSYYKKSGDSLEMPHVLTNIGGIYAEREMTDSALAYYQMSINLSEVIGDEIQTARTKHNMALIYMEQEDLQTAEGCLIDFLKLSRKTGYREGEAHALLGLGDLARKKGEQDKARRFYAECLELSDSIQFAKMQMMVHSNLSKQAESRGDLQNALRHYKMYSRVRDSLYNADRARIISEMQAKYEVQKKQHENDLLKAENMLKERRINALYAVIGGFMLLLIAIAVLIWQYRRIARARKMLVESEATRLHEKVEHQGRELASSALALSSNLTLISQLLENLKSLTPMVKEEGLPVLMNISRSIRRLDSDAAWKEFEMRFENVHTQFYENLTREFLSLTSNEMRLCAFLKLGMSTKEISAITFQEIRAIEAARFRLRKKFRLESSQDLNVFLQQF